MIKNYNEIHKVKTFKFILQDIYGSSIIFDSNLELSLNWAESKTKKLIKLCQIIQIPDIKEIVLKNFHRLGNPEVVCNFLKYGIPLSLEHFQVFFREEASEEDNLV